MAHAQTFPLKPWRVLPALVLGPVFAALALASFGVIRHQTLEGVGNTITNVLFFGVPVALLFGLPMFALYRLRRWDTRLAFAIGGALVGTAAFSTVPAGGLALLIEMEGADATTRLMGVGVSILLGGLVGIIPGALAGIGFWYGLYGGLTRTMPQPVGKRLVSQDVLRRLRADDRQDTYPLKPRRLALSIVTAPLLPAVLLGGPSAVLHSDISFAVLLLKAGVVAMFVLGLPIFWLYRKVGWDGRSAYALAGSFVGAVAFLVVHEGFPAGAFLGLAWHLSVAGAIPGVIGGLAFWFVLYAGLERTYAPGARSGEQP